MTWFMVSDDVGDHPKFDALRDGPCFGEAVALWTLAGSWLRKQLIDGDVPRGRIRLFGLAKPERAASELVRVGLWTETEAGYRFHNWLAYNSSRDEEMDRRAKSGNRQAKFRIKMRKEGVSNGVTNAPAGRDVTVGSRVTNAPLSSPLHSTPLQHTETRASAGPVVCAIVGAWKESFGRVPDAGTTAKLTAILDGELVDATREERRAAERMKAIVDQAPPEGVAEWARRAVEAWKSDGWAKGHGYPYGPFTSRVGALAAKSRPNHAPDDFSGVASILDRFGPEEP